MLSLIEAADFEDSIAGQLVLESPKAVEALDCTLHVAVSPYLT